MRPAELCILRPADIDRSGDVWVYRPSDHKTQHHGRGPSSPMPNGVAASKDGVAIFLQSFVDY